VPGRTSTGFEEMAAPVDDTDAKPARSCLPNERSVD
jgi:hypothetical protein